MNRQLRCHDALANCYAIFVRMKRSARLIFHVPKARFIGRSPASFFMHRRCASLSFCLNQATVFRYASRRDKSRPPKNHALRVYHQFRKELHIINTKCCISSKRNALYIIKPQAWIPTGLEPSDSVSLRYTLSTYVRTMSLRLEIKQKEPTKKPRLSTWFFVGSPCWT